MDYFVYLLECRDKSLYCGYSKNLKKRLELHNKGTASKYTKRKRPVKLVYFEKFSTQRKAMRREIEIKKMQRFEKIKLIKK